MLQNTEHQMTPKFSDYRVRKLQVVRKFWSRRLSCQSKQPVQGFLKNVICKEMASRVAGYTNQAGGDFHRQPATFDNLETEWIKFHVSLPNDPYT